VPASDGSGSATLTLDAMEKRHRVVLFDHLTPEAKRDFTAAASTRVVPAGDRIYTQDDRKRVLYRIMEGRVWLSYTRIDGRELLYQPVGPGQCLGISGLIDSDPLPQSATARSDVTLQMLDREAFTRLRRAHSCVDEAIMRSVLRDVRLLIGELAEAALDDLPSRVARRLLLIAVPGPRDTMIVDLPQFELAAMFGVSRQSLNKVLRGFEEEGLVQVAYGEVRVLDPDLLRRRSIDT
jgi:CRP/FNR family transcriptional regulator, cyclic AMP receptor protein